MKMVDYSPGADAEPTGATAPLAVISDGAPSSPGFPASGASVFLPRHALNPLVGAAHPLLEIGMLLRRGRQPPPLSLEELRIRLVAMVRTFVDTCAYMPTDMVAAARIACAPMSTRRSPPRRGAARHESARSLLVIFHGESSGGERFFTILHELSRDPSANIDALELLSVMLALGMQGRYRLSAAGHRRAGAGAPEVAGADPQCARRPGCRPVAALAG